MKRTNHLGPRVVLLAILLFVSMTAVSAQSLDGKWFVLNCKVTARAVNPDTGYVTQYNTGFKAYVYFSYVKPATAPRGSEYYCEVWSQSSPGNWVVSYSGDRSTSSISENFFPDWGMPLYIKDGANIGTFITPHVSVALNLFKAGGEIFTGEDPMGRPLFGWITISGQLAAGLPFHIKS